MSDTACLSYKIGGPEHWQQLVDNLAALVAELDRSLVPAIEAITGTPRPTGISRNAGWVDRALSQRSAEPRMAGQKGRVNPPEQQCEGLFSAGCEFRDDGDFHVRPPQPSQATTTPLARRA